MTREVEELRGGVQAPQLGHRVAAGFVWMAAQTLVVKVINTVGQLALAWLLTEKDFALVLLTYSVTTFTSFIASPGIDSILIQRRKVQLWGQTAFWMALSMGIMSCVALVVIAPLAVWRYHTIDVFWLALIVGLKNLMDSLGVVPAAQLTLSMRFRFLAVQNAVIIAGGMALSVLFALWDMGPYSIFVSLLIMSAIRTAWSWSAARIRIGWSPNIKRWKYLLGPSLWLVGGNFLISLVIAGDYMVLGLMYPEEKVALGIYYLAFNLSTQVIQVLSINLSAVLFPTFSMLEGEVTRQLGAFLRAVRILVIVGLPASVLQAVLAPVLIPLLLPARWQPAIALTQIMSLGLGLAMAGIPAAGLIKANGEFRKYFWVFFAYAVVFLGVVAIGAYEAQTLGTAISCSIVMGLSGPFVVRAAISHAPHPNRASKDAIMPAVILTVICYGIPALGTWLWRGQMEPVTVALAGSALYVLAIRYWCRDDWRDLSGLVMRITRKVGR